MSLNGNKGVTAEVGVNTTIDFYDRNAAEFCRKHDAVRLDAFHQTLRLELKPGTRLLEIGCGSGRDAAKALEDGYDVMALDGSKNLLLEIPKLHPELADRLIHGVLPCKLDFSDEEFDGFYSVACFMHFNEMELGLILKELKRILKAKGKGLISVPACRPDVTDEGVDIHNRVFHLRETEAWIDIFNKEGFEAKAGSPEPDKLGREGVWWVTFVIAKQ
jgi:SAM-dependent methyltransferase